MKCAAMQRDPLPVVNVASVPQRSPFRYPGGKTWLVPYVRRWLCRLRPRPAELIEPFAGGAIVGLTVVFEDLVERVVLVEKDEDVAAVWVTMLEPDGARWLVERILAFDPTPDNIHAVLAETATSSLRERAFRTLLRNRVQRGGILAPGAGLLRQGENGRGLASRWYPQTLARRILDIAKRRDRIRFIAGDGIAEMRARADRPGVAFYLDPPYAGAGRRLYRHAELDHRELFTLARRLAGPFLMSYEDAPEIRALAAHHGLEARPVPMRNTHHERKFELLIAREMSWLDADAATARERPRDRV
jgi:DNA adenine methylase